jgi:hypothetical protein
VTLVFGGGLFQVKPMCSYGPLLPCWDENSSRYGRGADVVLSCDDGDCHHKRQMPLLSRCQTSRDNLRQAPGRNFTERGGGCDGNYKREFILSCQ